MPKHTYIHSNIYIYELKYILEGFMGITPRVQVLIRGDVARFNPSHIVSPKVCWPQVTFLA